MENMIKLKISGEPRLKRNSPLRLAYACVVAFLFCLLIYIYVQYSREPSYDGRKLTHWLKQLESMEPDERSAAKRAISTMGTEVLPTLLYILDSKDNSLKRTVRQGIGGHGCNLLIVAAPTLKEEAVIAYQTLGARAVGSMPQLLAIITEEPDTMNEWAPENTVYASRAINEIGCASVQFLTNAFYCASGYKRCNIVFAIGFAGDKLPIAIPVLIDGSSDTNDLTRYYCVASLAALTNRTTDISNVMNRALNDRYSLIRDRAKEYLH